METLELKYLAPYLPHGLKIRVRINQIYGGVDGKLYTDKNIELTYKNISDFQHGSQYNKVKPILRPVSDLNSEKYNEWFNNEFDEIQFDFDNYTNLANQVSDTYLLDYPYEMVEWLIQQHFDIFGLIEKGLAIDINTLSDVNNLKNK